MLTSGQTASYISNALGISENLIYRWRNNQHGTQKVVHEPSELSLENQQLKERVRQLETEREILKKSDRRSGLSHFQPTDLRLRYELIHALTDTFTVETLCSVLGLSRSGYYRYKRGDSYKPTLEKGKKQQLIEQVFAHHKSRYGSRRIVAELKEQGHRIGRHQVRTLMKGAGLQSIQPKSFVPRTTDSTHGKGYWPNLLSDQPLPLEPDLVWVSNITYLPLVNGEWAYLGSWMDLFSRKVVGWRVDDNMEDDLIVIPLQNALQTRQPLAGLITHSDRGGQYVSNDLHELISLWHIRPA